VSTRRVAFATCRALPQLDQDDRVALPALSELGIEVVPVVWDDPAVDWSSFDLIVLRSCWDYDEKPAVFLAWLDTLEARGLPLQNPAAVARWNVDKVHLRGLAEAGVPVIPTVWARAGEQRDLAATLRELETEEAVVKPCISLDANGTWRVSAADAPAQEARFLEQLSTRDLMVQRYQPQIATDGEWSLVFLRGEYSHTSRKRPGPGDFRVQTERGGSRAAAEPAPELLTAARRVLAHCPGPHLYARVDGVRSGDAFLLMEVELIDPQLYLEDSPAGTLRFARAVRELAAAR